MTEQFVAEHREHKGLVGPFPTREAAWAWLHAQGPYPHDTTGSVQPVRAPA